MEVKTQILVILFSLLLATSVYSSEGKKGKSVCLYAGVPYTEGSLLKMGGAIKICGYNEEPVIINTDPDIYIPPIPPILKWRNLLPKKKLIRNKGEIR